jgi:hypothetical protein
MGRDINRTIYTVQHLHIHDKGHQKMSRIYKDGEIRKHNEAFKPQVISTPVRSSRESKRSTKRQ